MHTLYILLCADGSYYTGITRNMQRRLAQHNEGEVVYTATRLPVKLAYIETFAGDAEAVKREQQLKGWTRRKKTALIEKHLGVLPMLAKKTNWRRQPQTQILADFDEIMANVPEKGKSPEWDRI